ncbi:hypothetical protein E1B28_001778 [Marasmius oreades]|uniref:Uncharacterized protein n=1 Tax=Marasmius oreades TaxID=181124 RepID=A0A9P7V429_9AGAR|nr:uncharacterized protein E1B28_001778 [Marasmius oreades]KAG7099985.1 hypothetical protein E1B28_001778 [Marasmius oreades]
MGASDTYCCFCSGPLEDARAGWLYMLTEYMEDDDSCQWPPKDGQWINHPGYPVPTKPLEEIVTISDEDGKAWDDFVCVTPVWPETYVSPSCSVDSYSNVEIKGREDWNTDDQPYLHIHRMCLSFLCRRNAITPRELWDSFYGPDSDYHKYDESLNFKGLLYCVEYYDMEGRGGQSFGFAPERYEPPPGRPDLTSTWWDPEGMEDTKWILSRPTVLPAPQPLELSVVKPSAVTKRKVFEVSELFDLILNAIVDIPEEVIESELKGEKQSGEEGEETGEEREGDKESGEETEEAGEDNGEEGEDNGEEGEDNGEEGEDNGEEGEDNGEEGEDNGEEGEDNGEEGEDNGEEGEDNGEEGEDNGEEGEDNGEEGEDNGEEGEDNGEEEEDNGEEGEENEEEGEETEEAGEENGEEGEENEGGGEENDEDGDEDLIEAPSAVTAAQTLLSLSQVDRWFYHALIRDRQSVFLQAIRNFGWMLPCTPADWTDSKWPMDLTTQTHLSQQTHLDWRGYMITCLRRDDPHVLNRWRFNMMAVQFARGTDRYSNENYPDWFWNAGKLGAKSSLEKPEPEVWELSPAKTSGR